MSATNGSDKTNNHEHKAGPFSMNGGPAEAVRSKIAALLDNVTVNAGSSAAPGSSTTPTPKPPLTSALLVPGPTGASSQGGMGWENGSIYPAPAPSAAPPPVTPPLPHTVPQTRANGDALSSAPISNGPPLDYNHWNTQPLNTPPLQASPPNGSPSSKEANSGDSALNQAINIKGRTDGVSIEIGKGNWAELLTNLTERLAQASEFFRGGRVALDVGARPLLEGELQELHDLLEKVGLKLGAVRTKSERTFQAALSLGLATKLEPGGDTEGAEAQPAFGNRAAEQYFVYRGNLRSGQILQKREHILVLGDVNPGAEVISAGDIFVWGRLRGIAHAGADGDANSVIVAFELDPVQIQIVDVPGNAPEEPTGFAACFLKKRPTVKQPEIAYLHNHQIIIEPWNESRPGGLAAFRR